MKLLLGAACVLGAVSSGCSESEPTSGDGVAESGPSKSTGEQPPKGPTSGAVPEDPCVLLDAATVRKLAGRDLEGEQATVSGSSLPSCEYGRLDEVGVRVAQVPASEWARALPGILDQLEAAGVLDRPDPDHKLEDARQLIERGETIPSGQACALFSEMLELHGMPPGGDRIISFIPTKDDPQAASVQACIKGAYTSIVVGRPDLEAGVELESALIEALTAVL